MSYFVRSVLIVFTLYSCNKSVDEHTNTKPPVDETPYIINSSFKKGDTRRYGVFPDSVINRRYLKHLKQLIKGGFPITFSKGNYPIDLELKGDNNVLIYFEDATINGKLNIIETDNNIPSKNITLKGSLTVLDKVFIRHSNTIDFDTLIVKSNPSLALTKKRNRGVSIYAGAQNINIKKLLIYDLGSGDDHYKFSHAALQIHGWNNNPKNITIDHAVIESSDRHGAYITGSGHLIKNITIKAVGLGDFKGIYGLEDADKIEIDNATALWLNKCENTEIYHAIIDCKNTNANYTLNFDEGSSGNTTIIDTLNIINNIKPILYTDHILTNVVVRYYNNSSGTN